MSQNFEESPQSDSKMDISDTTSQESAGVSPIGECIISNNSLDVVEKLPLENRTDLESLEHSDILHNDLGIKNAFFVAKKNELELDNSQSHVLRLGQGYTREGVTNTALRCELTLANNHPLMSPGGGTDTDSENGRQSTNTKFNFPDVIPKVEQPAQFSNSGKPELSLKHMNNTSKNTPKITKSTLDVSSTNSTRRRKISLSPDLLSSESELEVSQYQANVEADYQTVALIANANCHSQGNIQPSPKPLTRRKIPISAELLSDDMSSLDSISNHSFDDDMEPNLASLSPSSSLMDGFNEKDDDFGDLDTPTNFLPTDPIPTYTAEEERRDSRNWQKITLPDGRTREIDMKVIEPYKRVLSHGGYLKAGGHNAIVMFCACHLPDRSRADYHYVMDNLFLYVVKTLEQLVTEDYVLIYLHGGSNSRNVPPFPWLKKCYQLLDRRLRKSLKNLYLVHPTFWLKSIVWMSRPFISSKFWRKLVYVRSLDDLYTFVTVEKAAIPDKVKIYDSKLT